MHTGELEDVEVEGRGLASMKMVSVAWHPIWSVTVTTREVLCGT